MRRLPLLPCLLALATLTAAEPAPARLLEGGFTQATGWNLGAGAAIEPVAGNPALVLRGDPAKGVSAVRELVCDPSWGVLRFRYRVNVSAITPGTEGWHNARIALTVTDAGGKVHHLAAGEWSQPTAGWVAADKLVTLPAGATRIKVSPAIFNAAGEMRLDGLVVELAARRGEGIDAQPPADQAPQWGQEPVEAHGPRRGAVCLNGVWRFMPAQGPAAETPQATGWGWQRVPGSWRSGPLPGKLVNGSGPAWEGWRDDSPAGWYERELAVPAAWAGRAIVLDLQRVSTDAAVFIDGKEAGRVSWPGGEVDLTAAVTPGATHRLRIKVVAVAEAGEVTRFMGMGEGQILKEKTVLATRGLIGDVLLASRPRGARLSGCAITTSVREGRLTVAAEYAGLAAAGPLELTAVVREAASGREARRFAATVPAAAGDGAVQAAWGWDDPQLWDVDQPNLYTLELAARGAGLDDCLVERFGFREFRIDGKRFLLNEREIRLRPAPIHAETATAGVREHIAGTLDGLRWAGFNTYEMWPWNRGERGAWAFDELWCAEADRRGILLITPALDMTRLVNDWRRDAVAADWERGMAAGVRRLRNHPSVVMWVTGANRFGHGQDQSPEVIGRRGDPADAGYRRAAEAGRDAIARIKRVDPLRPVFMHAGAAVGDVFTANNYLCLTPLQEREEWPSRWAADGDLPVLMVEFGTPLFTTFHRGRHGYGEAVVSEPLYTEFCAIYQGAEAYRLEGADYRRTLAATFEQGQRWKSWHTVEAARMHPGFNRLEALFQANTWRTWRTWGVTGGMLPWSNGHGWLRNEGSTYGGGAAGEPVFIPAGGFDPGRRGAWRPQVNRALLRYFRPEVMPLTEAGEALVAANQDTLGWIAGAAGDAGGFTDKTHHYRAGATLAKQIALINDSRAPQAFRARWSVAVAGREVARGEESGVLAPAQNRLLPLSAVLPAVAGGRAEGEVRLEATIAGAAHRDAFAFRVYPALPPAGGTVAVVDPQGDTAALLKGLGIEARPWDGGAAGLLVVGRRALSDGGADPARIAAAARAGARVLVMAQDPQWLRDRLGLRVAHQLSRRAFPAVAGHPALAGLAADELRDWAGHSRLLPATDLGGDLPLFRCPPHGWRWGCRHAVASAAIEVPHRAGWRPLLRCEFDGAYTPLAEVALGAGTLVLCTLDLEDHAAADPAAERLARALLAWAAAVPAQPRLPTVYLGGDEGAALVQELGVVHTRAQALPAGGLALLGAPLPDDAALDAFLRRGGRALVLAQRQERGPLGTTLRRSEAFAGSLAVPAWRECAGLWPGELRRRADGPAWLVADGAETGADGQLAVLRRGEGVAVLCQLDPAALEADRLSWNRLTRWRQGRAIAQFAANLGAELACDGRLLAPIPPPERLSLAGTWKATLTLPLPAASESQPKHKDPGPTPAALALVRRDADESGMEPVQAGKEWEGYGGRWTTADGEAVFRRTFEIPAAWAGRELVLSLGPVDDFDTAYVDGEAVGSTDATVKSFWTHARRYPIPARLATPGRHVVAVRVFDHFGGGGMVGDPAQMAVEPAQPLAAPPEPAYLPGWREDFALGDDPYRYYRW